MRKSQIQLIPFAVILTLLIAILSDGRLTAQESQGPPKLDGEVELSIADRYLPTGSEDEAFPRVIEETADIFQYSLLTFMSIRNDNWEIYTANGWGYDLKRITNNSASDYQPRFNRGATKIAFVSDRHGNWEIYTMDRGGSNVRRLTNNSAVDANPAWSFDGSKIVFESNRDGQYEIYAMNADGSSQTRLTNHDAYDADPSWSPDGSQIVFSSGRNNDGIWVMNADGSNPQQLVNKRFSENPAWSPDGSQIAFDADGSGDGWQEIWLMDADGSNQEMLYNPSSQVDPYVRSWSPDSRYIAFTRTNWTYYKGNWYWTSATPSYLDTVNNFANSFGSSLDREWYPDWQTTDIAPPLSSIESLPVYSRDEARIRWSGSDPGGSGIESYDVQYRIGQDGLWQDWYVNTTQTTGTFGNLPGKTVYFRCRATDRAGMKEEWRSGDGDTRTTFYNWKITGQTVDNRLVPLAGVTVSSTQQAFLVNPSDENGLYGAYFDGYESFFQVGFTKPDFAGLPTTQFSSVQDGLLDILMPPEDNVLLDPNFEGDLAGGAPWTADGLITPVFTDTQPHTGQQAVYFGRPSSLDIIAQLDAEVIFNEKAKPRQDANGRFHAVWHESAPNNYRTIYYAFGDQDGNWSAPVAPLPFDTQINDLYWDVTADGRVHIIWKAYHSSYDMLYHAWLDGEGWHGPDIVYNIGRDELYSFRLDSQGNGHLLWRLSGTGIDDFYYRYVNQEGVWSSPERLFVQYEYEPYNIVIDQNDVVHLQWSYSGDDLFHNYRLPDGSWSELEKVAPGGYNWHNDLIIDDLNGVHLVWGNVSSGKIFHSKRQSDGSWSVPTILSEGTNPDDASFKAIAANDGGLFIAWSGGEYSCRELFMAQIDPSGAWTGTGKLNPVSECVSDLWLQRQGQRVVLFTDFEDYSYHQFCQLELVSGENTSLGDCASLSNDNFGWDRPLPLIGVDGLSHVFWRKGQYLIHSRSAVSDADGQSSLYQTVNLPVDLLNPTLSFAYLQGYNGGDEQLGLRVSVTDALGSTPIFSGTQTSGWAYQWLDLSPWSGQQITVTFSLQQKAGEVFISAYLDEAFLGTAYPDTWVTIERPPDVLSGEQLALILHYGNQSSAVAENNLLTLTLPPELAFVSADPAPTSQSGPTVDWELGQLVLDDGLGTILVTTEVSSGLALGLELPVIVELAGPTPEINENNNSHQVFVFVGRRDFLPLILRP